MRIVTESVNLIPIGYGAKGDLYQYAHTGDFYNHSTNTGSYGHIVLKNNTTPAYGELTFNTPTIHPLGRIKQVKVTARIGFRSDSRMLTAWYELYLNGSMKGTRQTIDITKNSNKLYTLTVSGISPSDLNDIRLRIGGTTKYNAIAIGVTEYRTIFVYGVDIDIDYDLYYYQVTANTVGCKEILHTNAVNINSTPLTVAELNALPVGTEKLLSICGVSSDTGVFGSQGTSWTSEKYFNSSFPAYGSANLNDTIVAQNMQIVYGKITGYMQNGDVMAFKFKRVNGGFTIQNKDGYYLSNTSAWISTPTVFTLVNVDVDSSGTALIYLSNNPALASIEYNGNYLRWENNSDNNAPIDPSWRNAVSSWEKWMLYEISYSDSQVIESIETSTIQTSFDKDEQGNILYRCKVDGVDTYPSIGFNGLPYIEFKNISADHTIDITYSTHNLLQKRDDKWKYVRHLYKNFSNEWKFLPLRDFINQKNNYLLETPYSFFYKKPLTTTYSWIKGIKFNHNTGVEESSSTAIGSDYIKVNSGTTYLMSASRLGGSNGQIYAILIYAYDANKNYLGRVHGPSYDVANAKDTYCYFDAPNGYNANKDASNPVGTYERSYENFDITPYLFDNSGSVSCEDTSHNNRTYTGNIAYIRIRVTLVNSEDYYKDDVIEEKWVELYTATNEPYASMGTNDPVVGSYANNKFTLSSSLPNGNYSLVYETEKGVPVEGWDNFSVANKEFAGLIPENIAPYVADRIGVYNDEGARMGYIPVGSFKPNYGERLYRFGIVSDVHYNDRDDNNTIQDDGTNYHSDLICAMRYFEGKEDVEFVCCGGDITSNYIAQAKIYHDAVTKYAPTTNIYTCKGNHDNQASYNNGALWKEYTYPANNPYTTYFFDSANPNNIYAASNGTADSYYFIRPCTTDASKKDVFVFFSVDYNRDSPNSDGTRYYSPESITWLSAVLEQYKNNRVFLFTHLFFWKKAGNCNEYYYPGNHSSEYVLFGDQYTTLNALNNQYKNVIWFTGHSHYKWRYQPQDTLGTNGPNYRCNVCNYDQDTHSTSAYNVHIPSLAVPLVSQPSYQADAAASECGVVDVYEDCIVVRGIRMDNTTDQSYEYRAVYIPIAQYRLGIAYNGTKN